MRHRYYAELSAFIAVARRGSFSKAAADLGVTKATVSEAVRTLETRMGVQLLHRTTRSVVLTEVGERMLARISPLITALDSSLEEIEAFRDVPAGSLRLKVVPTAAHMIVAPLVAAFRKAYPAIRLEIAISHDRGDLVEGHYDAGIRIGFNIPREMVAVPLSPDIRPAIVASPGFCELYGTPASPSDLQRFNCIALRLPNGSISRWRFLRDGAVFDVRVSGSPVVDDAHVMLHCILDGIGIGYMHPFWVEEHIQAKRLTRVLTEWTAPQPGFQLYFPSRGRQPAALIALLAFIKNGGLKSSSA